jgi:HAE1 family hydrophobic/amphiphilic exporter-1
VKFSLPAQALRRPVTVLMLVITVAGLGAIALSRTPVEFLPEMDFPFIICQIPYPGATPEQVEQEIAIPAEGEFRTVSQLERIVTISNSGGAMVRLVFDFDADMGLAASEMRDRMERLKLVLPAGVDRMFLLRFSMDMLPVMYLSLASDLPADELAHLAESTIKARLQRLDGVADVEVMGRRQREVLVEFDQDQLRARNLGLYQVVSALRNASLNVSVGQMHEGRTTYFVRVLDEFRHPDEIADLVIGPNSLRVSDVADVSYQPRGSERRFAIDGRESVIVMVRKEAEANTVAVCEAVRDELGVIENSAEFGNIETLVFFDQSEVITSALDALLKAGRYGALLAVFVLYLFLRRLRPTLLVALAIPSSVLVALIYMYFAGMSLNLVTMLALIVAFGMLVDNSIVVIENIYRYNQLGCDSRESAGRGASEVGLAITAATLTTLVVFVPILYLESGQMATYMREFGMPITVALVASLVIALTVIPLAASYMRELARGDEHWLARAARRTGLARPESRGGLALLGRFHPLQRTIDGYVRFLGWTQRRRFATVVLIAIVFVVTAVIPLQHVAMREAPEPDRRQIDIGLDFDPNIDLEAAGAIVDAIIARVEPLRDDLGIRTIFHHYNAGNGSVMAFLVGDDDLPSGEDPPYTTEQVRDILWQSLPERVPGAEIQFRIAEMSEDEQDIALSLRGDDAQQLAGYAEALRARLLREVPALESVETSRERTGEELQLRIDEVLAGQAGVTPLAIAQTVDFALRGFQLPYLKWQGREVPVWAQYREEDRKTRANLENVGIQSERGGLIPLTRLVNFTTGRSPASIYRENGKNVLTVSAQTREKNLSEVVSQVRSVVGTFELPLGYSVEMGESIRQMDTDMSNFGLAMLLSCILIYVVMGALFESYVLPLSILWSVPMAFVGVVWVMYATDTPFDTVALIGMILMTGIIVNNGIVIIDHINQLRAGGSTRYDAILQAGRDRFRPVMMTALTTILGCVPIALGDAGGSQVAFYGFGRALIGGLASGTVLTLVVVPLVYTLVDDLRVWLQGFFGSVAGLAPGRRASAD